MIVYNFPVPDWVEVLLKAAPDAFNVLDLSSKFQTDSFRIRVKCGNSVLVDKTIDLVKRLNGKIYPAFRFTRQQVFCAKPQFDLVLSVTRRSRPTLTFVHRLRSTLDKDGWDVYVDPVRVRTWVKRAHVTVSRKYSRERFLRPRRTRPNPEERFSSRTFFLQRADNIQQLTNESVVDYRRTWTGTTTPGFKSIRRRDLPVNNHRSDTQVNNDGGYLNVYKRWEHPADDQVYIRGYTLGHGIAGVPFPFHLDNSTDVAIQRLVDKMGQTLEANLAQDMAQMGQLTRLITGTSLRITRSLSALRRKDFSGAIGHLWNGTTRGPRFHNGAASPTFTSSLANNWLELQYGWKPLLMDIHGSLDSLARFYNLGEHVTRTVSASAKKEEISVSDLLDHVAHTHAIGSATNRIQTRVKFVLRYRIDSRLKAFLAQTGFTNPLNTLWEILPYSFVVDWMLPVGNYLQTISSYDGLEFVDGSLTQFTKQDYLAVIYSIGPYGSMDPRDENYEFGSYQRTRVILDRSKLTSFPRPNPPRLKNPLSVTHALNALALVKSAFSR